MRIHGELIPKAQIVFFLNKFYFVEKYAEICYNSGNRSFKSKRFFYHFFFLPTVPYFFVVIGEIIIHEIWFFVCENIIPTKNQVKQQCAGNVFYEQHVQWRFRRSDLDDISKKMYFMQIIIAFIIIFNLFFSN